MTALGGLARWTVALVPRRGTCDAHVLFYALRIVGGPFSGGHVVAVIGCAG